MIIILSYNGDAGTTPILEWLQRLNVEYMRVNLEDEDFRKISIVLENGVNNMYLSLTNGKEINISEVNYFFYRGGRFSFKSFDSTDLNIPSPCYKTQIRLEYETLTNYFYKEISKKCLGNLLLYPFNKLDQLKVALDFGIQIPNTYVCGSKTKLDLFNNSKQKLITKAIQENILGSTKDAAYEIKVEAVENNKISEVFFPSLFQESIDKKMEIRTFYLDGTFYSLGMIHNTNMYIDFRKHTNELRYFPFSLPKEIEDKLERFMRSFNLNTGSIDLMLSNNNDYYYLEVNPTGQYGWVSDYGNYCIEKRIAEYLKEKDKNVY